MIHLYEILPTTRAQTNPRPTHGYPTPAITHALTKNIGKNAARLFAQGQADAKFAGAPTYGNASTPATPTTEIKSATPANRRTQSHSGGRGSELPPECLRACWLAPLVFDPAAAMSWMVRAMEERARMDHSWRGRTDGPAILPGRR